MPSRTTKWFNVRSTTRESKIVIDGTIGDDGGRASTAQNFLAEFNAVPSNSKLDVEITSEGGSLFDGLAIYARIRQHPGRVRTHVIGLAGSAGSIIAMAGHEVLISDGSFLFVHEVSGGEHGRSKDLRDMADTIDKMNENLIDIYAHKTGLSRTRIANMLSAETWLSATEAKNLGLVDEVVSDNNSAMAARGDFRLLDDSDVPVHVKDALVARQPRLLPLEDFDLMYPHKGKKSVPEILADAI